MVNNAGIILRQDAIEFTEQQWDAVMDLNIKSLFFLSQAVARQFIRQGDGGKIINITPILALIKTNIFIKISNLYNCNCVLKTNIACTFGSICGSSKRYLTAAIPKPRAVNTIPANLLMNSGEFFVKSAKLLVDQAKFFIDFSFKREQITFG